jgi:hypothetical protein
VIHTVRRQPSVAAQSRRLITLASARTKALPRAALIAGVLSSQLLQGAFAAAIAKRVHGDGGDFVVACDAGPFTADYAAETASGVPLASRYAVERGADKGLVRLMARGGRRVQKYEIPRAVIRALVRVKLDADIPDRADLVFTTKGLTLVHTATADGGIFTDSDVYQLPYSQDGGVDDSPDRLSRDLREMLRLGLSVYDIHAAKCSM